MNTKHSSFTHSERCQIRHQLNGKPYTDNPKRFPYDNEGRLIERIKQNTNLRG